jgi:hypothetical protein
MTNIRTAIRNIFIVLAGTIMLSSCLKDKLTKTYTIYSPVYKSKQEVLASIKISPAQPIAVPGKIYMYGKYIFLNEVNKGVHLIDNTNPANPKSAGYISIPGNLDIAVKGNTLYADMYSDLLAIDITDPVRSRLLNVIPGIFPERSYGSQFVSDTSLVLVDWLKKDTTIDLEGQTVGAQCRNCFFSNDFAAMSNKSQSNVPGVGGSMARFAIVKDYLYTVGQSDLGVISISNSGSPVKLGKQTLGWDIETIFPFKEKLFIGSSTRMFIFSIADPSKPVQEAIFTHATACDPVIADDNYAYVTLRTGNFCVGNRNVLDVVDVANISSPKRVRTYQMVNPHGLSKDGSLLFICDGKDGIKMYDASSPDNLQLIFHQKGLESFDAIAWNNTLLVVATDGMHQYDYSDKKTLRHLSSIPINRNSK